jgi:hypothetical protein
MCRAGAAMARRWWQQVEGSRITRRKTSKSNQDERLTSMMQIETHQPLLSSLEIQARANRDANLKSVLNDPGALKIPGIESLEVMRQNISELQAAYEIEAQRLASEQATLESLNGQLETERGKLSHGEYLFRGSKDALDTLSATIGQCLTSGEQGKLQSVLLVRAGNTQYVEVWPAVKKAILGGIKRLETEILKLTKGGSNE